jgi:glycerophosphoryl diester phosphodiesterase
VLIPFPLRLLAGLLLALLTTSCLSGGTVPEHSGPGSDRPVQVLGHAGSGFFTPISPFNPWPPSSLGGVLHALRQGADGVEVDLQLSRDSVPMLYHNGDLPSMTNGSGCISQHRAADLVKLRYRGGRPYDLFQRERPVTLDTLLARCRRQARYPYLHFDMHDSDECAPAGHKYDRVPILVRQIARRVRRHRVPADHLLIISMQPGTLRYLRAALPAVSLGLEITGNFDAGLRTAQAEKVQAVVLSADYVTPERALAAREAGLLVVVFGGRSAGDLRRVMESRPDAIEVDNVGRLMAMLDRKPGEPAPVFGSKMARQ